MNVENYQSAIILRVKTPDMIMEEQEEPGKANFSQFDYHFPTGFIAGVGKSKRPSHASLFQIIVSDFNGMPNIKFPKEYSGEYTSTTRAEKALHLYCKEAWEAAEAAKTKSTRKAEVEKVAANESD